MGEKVETKEVVKLEEPKKYKVFLLNDDYTTMDFVVDILCDIFDKSYEEAVNIMLTIHRQGKGLCGIYTYEIAETKIDQVHRLARAHEFPLKAVMEEE
ncbi:MULTISPECIES: ATP-dependent Clp protease adapter ClpS [unclassified Nitratiruptor]|uniref:ATP-dependent Clp protease adapter ClpS n=1 Tax=unclassified Nitratiruptor TaxID=2624044 RepID=UPI0001586E92|nr:MULTISPECIES: ATP-dependent Clp protease adapter ClpS [unclassified Nitratiruptor]BAF69493.1 ATP-dependent Clp protease, adaptor protein ClpS [Nitratiruptor sp. SB155-2]BCD59716.1 ATP-dependent Clp protease adaptor protein ClpS [Nitratiruptor sp. YY08-10]BCD63640.1 ATP-dependent Clp protease adaptor protein ClpS [Nitratiruptor sp. YY08-14]